MKSNLRNLIVFGVCLTSITVPLVVQPIWAQTYLKSANFSLNNTLFSERIKDDNKPLDKIVQGEKFTQYLEVGSTISRSIKSGEIQAYKADLKAGQYVHLTVEQIDIDLVLDLYNPANERVESYNNSPRGKKEEIAAPIAVTGTYKLLVRSVDKSVMSGSYKIEFQEISNAKTIEVQSLELNRLVKREISGKEIHNYQIFLEKGQYARVSVEQVSIDVMLAVYDPKNDLIDWVDGSHKKTELFEVLAKESGNYRFQVSPGSALESGNYTIKLEALGKLSKSRKFVQSKKSAQSSREIYYLANEHFRLGKKFQRDGKWEEAIKSYQKAGELFQKAGESNLKAADTYIIIGSIYSHMGDFQKGLGAYETASDLSKAYFLEYNRVLLLIAETYALLGKYHQALDISKQVFDVYKRFPPELKKITDRKFEALIPIFLGNIYLELDEFSTALKYFQQGLSIINELSNSFQIDNLHEKAYVSLSFGVTYLKLDDFQKALEAYKQALVGFQVKNDRTGEALALLGIGTIYLARKQTKDALDYYNRALETARDVKSRVVEATMLYNVGLIYRDTNRPKKAIDHLEQSVQITLKIRGILQREHRRVFLETKRESAIALTNLLLKQNQPEKAFEWINLATTADLADYSRLIKAKVGNPQAQKAIHQWNQSNFQLESLRKQLQQEFSPQRSQQVNQRQEKVNQKAEDIRNRFTEVAELFETKPTDITELQAKIPLGTTAIQPVLLTKIKNVPSTIALFILTKDKVQVKQVPVDPAKFDALLTQTNAQLTNRFDDQYFDNLEQLYNLLIRPVEAEIQTTKPKHLAFITTGKLRYIPLEALYDAKKDQYLIQKYPISYLTRLSKLTLKAEKTLPTKSAKKILAFANPVPKPPLALPDTEAEVKSITPIFPGSELFLRSKATLKTFKIQSPRFSVLHLATHGCFQKGGCPKLGLDENILLFADQKYNIADAALLGLPDIDLITLSACQTALKTDSNGEEISGLAYLFERAGARAIIATLWSVPDKENQEIMVQFYENLKQGMSKDEALRNAKLSQIDSHPWFWAAPVLIGDAR